MCTTVEQVFEQVKDLDERVFEWWDWPRCGRLARYPTGAGTAAAVAAYGQERTSARARFSTNGSACL